METYQYLITSAHWVRICEVELALTPQSESVCGGAAVIPESTVSTAVNPVVAQRASNSLKLLVVCLSREEKLPIEVGASQLA